MALADSNFVPCNSCHIFDQTDSKLSGMFHHDLKYAYFSFFFFAFFPYSIRGSEQVSELLLRKPDESIKGSVNTSQGGSLPARSQRQEPTTATCS